MLLWVFRPLKFLAGTMRDLSSPRRIAVAVALGMLVGLVPKDNLTAVLLGMLLLTLRVNLAAGSLSALFFTWIGKLSEPILDRAGYALLVSPSLEPIWSRLYQLPLVPWTGLNNTILLGSLVFGLALVYPAYHITSRCLLTLSEKYGDRILEELQKYRIYQVCTGADFASAWSWKG